MRLRRILSLSFVGLFLVSTASGADRRTPGSSRGEGAVPASEVAQVRGPGSPRLPLPDRLRNAEQALRSAERAAASRAPTQGAGHDVQNPALRSARDRVTSLRFEMLRREHGPQLARQIMAQLNVAEAEREIVSVLRSRRLAARGGKPADEDPRLALAQKRVARAYRRVLRVQRPVGATERTDVATLERALVSIRATAPGPQTGTQAPSSVDAPLAGYRELIRAFSLEIERVSAGAQGFIVARRDAARDRFLDATARLNKLRTARTQLRNKSGPREGIEAKLAEAEKQVEEAKQERRAAQRDVNTFEAWREAAERGPKAAEEHGAKMRVRMARLERADTGARIGATASEIEDADKRVEAAQARYDGLVQERTLRQQRFTDRDPEGRGTTPR
jgi:hypothetical protein